MDYIGIVQAFAIVAIAAGVWRKAERSVIVNVPEIKLPQMPELTPAQIKVVMPADIEKATTAAHKIDIGQRLQDLSDGTHQYQWIGEQTVINPYDRSTWPARLEVELATSGRAIRLPNGQIDEGVL